MYEVREASEVRLIEEVIDGDDFGRASKKTYRRRPPSILKSVRFAKTDAERLRLLSTATDDENRPLPPIVKQIYFKRFKTPLVRGAAAVAQEQRKRGLAAFGRLPPTFTLGQVRGFAGGAVWGVLESWNASRLIEPTDRPGEWRKTLPA